MLLTVILSSEVGVLVICTKTREMEAHWNKYREHNVTGVHQKDRVFVIRAQRTAGHNNRKTLGCSSLQKGLGS